MSEDTLPIVERLRSRAWEHRHHRKYRAEAADAIEMLAKALEPLVSGCNSAVVECRSYNMSGFCGCAMKARDTLDKVRAMR